jgi:hypothetical protein
LCATSAKIRYLLSNGRRKKRISHQNSDETAGDSSQLTHYIIYSVCASVAGEYAVAQTAFSAHRAGFQ